MTDPAAVRLDSYTKTSGLTPDELCALSELQRYILAGHMVLFLGEEAPKSVKAPTKLELAQLLYEKYTGASPQISNPELLLGHLLRVWPPQ